MYFENLKYEKRRTRIAEETDSDLFFTEKVFVFRITNKVSTFLDTCLLTVYFALADLHIYVLQL